MGDKNDPTAIGRGFASEEGLGHRRPHVAGNPAPSDKGWGRQRHMCGTAEPSASAPCPRREEPVCGKKAMVDAAVP